MPAQGLGRLYIVEMGSYVYLLTGNRSRKMGTIMDVVSARDPYEKEFHQAVHEVVESVKPVLDKNPE